jgi:endonuclease/exonuclease/phosphatase (EEP) superfamily protein YafD
MGFLGAYLLPVDQIWAVAMSAVLWSSLPWMGILWPVWTAMVSIVGRTERRWMLVSLGVLAFAGLPVQCTDAHLRAPTAGGLDVAVFNVNAYSPDPTPAPLFSRIEALSPDVLVILERRFEDVPGYIRVADDFPAAWPRPSHHSAVYVKSDVRAEARVTEQLGSPSQSMPVAVVWLPDAGVCVLGIHAPPQVPKDASGMGPYVHWLTQRIDGGRVLRDLAPCPDGAPLVLSGDFNHVPASATLGRLRDQGLTDVLSGTGLTGLTWPSGGGWLDFPVFRLDHVLAGPVILSELRKTRLPGSDHQCWLFRVQSSEAP